MSVTIVDQCAEEEFLNAVRLNGLLKFNMEKTNGRMKIPNLEFIYVAREGDGEMIGGVSGSTYLSSLEVEVLWVKEGHRGKNIATRLLKEIEDGARKAGCRLSHLTTYSFQAPDFYQKQGYIICGELDGFPDDIKLYLLKKRL